jgi:phosphate transport system substrate-binding protein
MEAQDTARIDLRVFPLEGALDAAEGGIADVIVAGTQPTQGWFATPLSLAVIAVIVHPSNNIRSLNLEDLTALFNGEIDSWAEFGGDDLPVQTIIPLPSDETREYMNSRVLEDSGFSPDAFIAPSPIAMVAMVTEDEGAIGFIPLSQATDEVRVVRVDGILPQPATVSDGRYPLYMDILALAPEQPRGAAHEWLAWIQASQSVDSP